MDGVADQVGIFLEVQFFHDAGAMILNGAKAEKHDGGDFLAGFTFGDEADNFNFPGSEGVGRARGKRRPVPA